jgi:2-phosphosulfolactate phosphatase
MSFDQAAYDIRCEWGLPGIAALAASVDVLVIVDVLSFCTCVEIATTRGAAILPYPAQDDSAERLALQEGAELARARGRGGYSLSPASYLTVATGTRIVLPSPNGASLSLATGRTPTLAGCLRNAAAVARAANQLGRCVAVIPAGEHWPDGSLRPALEDLLGAGAIVDHLTGSLSPEAQAAADLYRASVRDFESRIQRCNSGRELIDRGFERDVMLACEFDVSAGVPILVGNVYVRLSRLDHNDRYLKG